MGKSLPSLEAFQFKELSSLPNKACFLLYNASNCLPFSPKQGCQPTGIYEINPTASEYDIPRHAKEFLVALLKVKQHFLLSPTIHWVRSFFFFSFLNTLLSIILFFHLRHLLLFHIHFFFLLIFYFIFPVLLRKLEYIYIHTYIYIYFTGVIFLFLILYLAFYVFGAGESLKAWPYDQKPPTSFAHTFVSPLVTWYYKYLHRWLHCLPKVIGQVTEPGFEP